MRRLEDAAARAMQIDDEGREVPEPKRLDHVAMDLRKPKRIAPYYIDVLTRRQENAEKIEAAKDVGPAVQLNIGTVQIAVPQYPVHRLEEPKE